MLDADLVFVFVDFAGGLKGVGWGSGWVGGCVCGGLSTNDEPRRDPLVGGALGRRPRITHTHTHTNKHALALTNRLEGTTAWAFPYRLFPTIDRSGSPIDCRHGRMVSASIYRLDVLKRLPSTTGAVSGVDKNRTR